MENKSKTFVWQYFDKTENNEEAKCKKCSVLIKCKGCSTSGLLRHLKNKHSIDKPSAEVSACVNSAAKRDREADPKTNPSKCLKSTSYQPTLVSFMRKVSKITMEEMISKLVAVDGFPISAISKSEFIRHSFSDKGFNLPKNPNRIMQMVYKQYETIKDEVIREIEQSINHGKRFSLTLDEYSSLKNKRYLNINVHEDKNKFWNLGMVAINGRFTAEKMVIEVKEKLSEFNLSMEPVSW